MPKHIIFILLLICTSHISLTHAQTPKDASGVVYEDGYLYIVGNKSNRYIFKYNVDITTLEVSKTPKIKLNKSLKITKRKAKDLEGIALLNGQPVALSENSCKVYTDKRVLMNYSTIGETEERHNKGLEGLAIENIDNNSSKVATLWEGGWHDQSVYNPFIIIHSLKHDLENEAGILYEDHEVFRLDQNALDHDLRHRVLDSTDTETILGFRAPELLWYDSSLIILLVVDWDKYYHRRWLCKIDNTSDGYEITDYCEL
ncbi:MAG: hypothetical protein RIG62_14680 [Cyclobacteriaceae bacterium]